MIDIGILQFIANKKFVSLEQLSTEYQFVDRSKLERLLNLMVAKGVVMKDCDTYYIGSENLDFFDETNNSYIGNYVSHLASHTRDGMNCIGDILRKGESIDAKNTFHNIYGDVSMLNTFLDSMWNIGYKDTNAILDSIEDNLGEIVDLGGGSGVFSILCSERDKCEKAIIYDFPSIRNYVLSKIKESNLVNKVSFQSGNFMEDSIPKADSYALGYVLSDYGDYNSREILQKVYESLNSGGRVLIMDKILDSGKTSPTTTVAMDVCMMFETGGKHRSFSEYKLLLESVGFLNISFVDTVGDKKLIMGYKR